VSFWDLVDAALAVQLTTFGEPDPVVVFFAAAPPEGYATRGIFDAPAIAADVGLHREVSDQAPWIAFRVAELPGGQLPRLAERLTVRGVDWEIADVHPDGDGHVKCRLFRLGPWAPVPPPRLEAPLADSMLPDSP
jgi:hypothetical protein